MPDSPIAARTLLTSRLRFMAFEAQAIIRCASLPVLAAAEAWGQLAPLLTLEELIAAGDRLVGRPEPLSSRGQIESAVRLFSGKRGAKLLRHAYGQVLLEYDGDHHRLDDAQYAHDVDRLNALAADGWPVIRVGKRTSLRNAIGLTRQALERAHARARAKEQRELHHLGHPAPR